MKTEIILLIIAFQVVAGILSKRKAKRAREAAGKRPEPERPPQPATPSRQPGGAAAPAGKTGGSMETGKDLLSQLAKELGWQIPGQARTPAPSKPAPQDPRAQAARADREPAPIDSRMETAKRASPARIPRSSAPEEAEPAPRIYSNLPVTPEAEPPTLSSQARESLMDVESIRRAFILKTILDKPLSVQPRLPGVI